MGLFEKPLVKLARYEKELDSWTKGLEKLNKEIRGLDEILRRGGDPDHHSKRRAQMRDHIARGKTIKEIDKLNRKINSLRRRIK
ncbi:hypothetical protein CL621_04015 [archaeon]|nr:hypothetical protein [archaeon]|tara:strand:- start:2467 stop:2718 length:252 start_codon:yes stop_codon:yes gene_type:complete